jgi:hypothetical protein
VHAPSFKASDLVRVVQVDIQVDIQVDVYGAAAASPLVRAWYTHVRRGRFLGRRIPCKT